MSRYEQTRIIKEKIAEIENVQKKLEKSKQGLYDIIKLDLTCEHGFGKYQ